jgi:hypothetical protein
VPPVTELAMSVPGCLRTGADSPVIADSSTEPIPSITSPSAGITSPATSFTRSPRCKAVELTDSIEPSARIFRAIVSLRVDRRASAWAFPRPSAIASAKLANSTVKKRIRVMMPLSSRCCPLSPAIVPNRCGSIVTRAVTIVPNQTTNRTGLRTAMRGSSLRKDCRIAL